MALLNDFHQPGYGQAGYLCRQSSFLNNMKQPIVFFLAIAVVFIAACGDADKARGNAVVKTKADTLLDEVNDGHNIGMARMGQLTRTRQEAVRLLDSLALLPAKAQAAAAPHTAKLENLLQELNYAEFAMDKWMSEFRWDSAFATTQGRISYLETEKEKVANVKEAILQSLQHADSLLKKRL
ncbi:MAG: hypothetical protein ABW019_08170 [Chitinophagaceae bacterium]